MRNSYKYKVTSANDLVNRLLAESKKTSYITILLSNQIKKKTNFPRMYINYDLIAGVERLIKIKSNNKSFKKIRDLHSQYSDWMFGYLSYDLKNEIDNDLRSENEDNIQANNISFFIPKYVFLLKGDELEVLTFSKKEEVDLYIKSLSYLTLIKKHNIILQQKEDKNQYIEKINKIKGHIQRGDIYEMNYCLEYFSKNSFIDPETLFFNLNNVSSTPFSGFLHIGEHYILCASPERFLRKKGSNVISQPIKGTIKRGITKLSDQDLVDKLINSQKDISENVMITDLVRNDLSITAKKSSVNVDEFCKVYTFKNIHQMITTISSEVKQNVHFTELLASTFPMGSMTGAPKRKAMQLIERYEEFRRGLFSGSIGYITPEGDFDFNVIIRTILYNSQERYLSVGVGGAITIKSEPHEEYEECLLKIAPILKVLG